MRKIIMTATLLLASISQADIIRCSFTEPFFDTTYSMAQSTLTYESAIDKKVAVIKNVSFQIKAAGVFELVKNGKVLQTLTLTNKGSNGMSDTVYPFDVEDAGLGMMKTINLGGCESNGLKAVEPKQ